MKGFYILCLVLLVPYASLFSQAILKSAFKVIPLGVKGGIDESNLSAYMLAPEGSNDYVCLDAGTLHYGIQKAVDEGIIKDNVTRILQTYIRGYLVSHPHLDHVSGLIINSPDDSAKNIYGLAHCINILKDKYFSWQNWANFGDEGEKPVLKKYHYAVLEEEKEVPLEHTPLFVKAFPLSHSNPYESTAFLIRHGENYFLYLGDTGADSVEKSNKLSLLWQHVAPLIKAGKLHAIFIEVSYPDEQPATQLFGHLTPHLLMQEMHSLGKFAGVANMKGLPIAITHMKPSGNHEDKIIQQLKNQNNLQLKLVFPKQGKVLKF